MQKMITDKQLAAMLELSVGAIRKWRESGYGPAAIKLGDGKHGCVRYRLEDVLTWIESRSKG